MVGGNYLNFAERPLSEKRPDGVRLRQVTRPHRLHRQDARCACRGAKLRGLGSRQREGLLDEHRLAGGDHFQCQRPVLIGRDAYVHRVDRGIADER
jgi:hypothetical protein